MTEINKELLQELRKRFETQMSRELDGSRDLEWFLTKDAKGNYPCNPIQHKWVEFKGKHPELNGLG